MIIYSESKLDLGFIGNVQCVLVSRVRDESQTLVNAKCHNALLR